MKTRNSTAEKMPTTFDGSTGKPDPTPREIKLKTADDVRLEMGKVYRDMRKGSIDMGDGTKLVYVLGHLGKIIETSEIEKRMEALEIILNQRKKIKLTN